MDPNRLGDSPKPERLYGIAGGSGSGKSTVARAVKKHFGQDQVQVIVQDSYYRNNSHLSFEERTKINYDHPDAFDIELFVKHLKTLRSGQGVDVPVYDYAQHTRSDQTTRLEPSPVLIVEGLLVLAIKSVRELLDVKIFVDTPADIRLIRRLRRDTQDRGRSVESVLEQYEMTVRPMHEAFVEASKRHADVIFPEGYNDKAMDMLNAKIRQNIDRNLVPS